MANGNYPIVIQEIKGGKLVPGVRYEFDSISIAARWLRRSKAYMHLHKKDWLSTTEGTKYAVISINGIAMHTKEELKHVESFKPVPQHRSGRSGKAKDDFNKASLYKGQGAVKKELIAQEEKRYMERREALRLERRVYSNRPDISRSVAYREKSEVRAHLLRLIEIKFGGINKDAEGSVELERYRALIG